MAWQAALCFLVVLEMLPADQAERLGAPRPAARIERYRVVRPCIARTERLRLIVPVTGFVAVARGAQVARDGDQPVLAPLDAVVLAPRPARPPGEPAFIWGMPIA